MSPQFDDLPRRLQESALPNTSSMDKYDDELSIAASDEDDGSSQDSEHHINSKGDKAPKKAQPVDFVKNETLGVNVLRYVIVFLLVTSGVLFCVATYFVVSDADEQRNTCSSSTGEGNDFEGFVQALQTNLGQATAARLSAAFTLSALYTSQVLESSEEWPQVSVANFEALTTGTLQTTSTSRVIFSPLVNSLLRSDFEAYAILQQQPECQFAGCVVVEEIYNTNGEPIGDNDVLSPVWQAAPGYYDKDTEILWNQFSDELRAQALLTMLDLKAAVYSNIRNASDTLSTTLFYPIFQDFKQVDVVGSLSMELDWLTLLNYSMPFPYEGVTLHLENSCQTGLLGGYEVQNGGLVYLGAVSLSTDEAKAVLDVPGSYQYGEFATGLNGGPCKFMLHVLPSEEMSAETASGNSNRAAAYTSAVAVVLFIIIFVFLIYDWLVEKRQSVVVNIATKSSAIVENLFPAQVRDRMLQNMAEKRDAKAENGDQNAPADNGSGNVINPSSNAATPLSVKQFLTNMPENTNDFSSQPIADLFPNTTVLFADIAGFTAWSSQREPPQVFTLLETLYRSFDVIAGKLKVFKVETIGDCYMAVTGLPNPDEAHAVHMSRFAYQCLIGMRELIKELEAVLGPGTSDLALRVGLHSGPVTAGVLRGEKSRLQLFGDTVNTASRMESTGERGRIQVSQETADLLMAAGKSHWLKAREDLVVAKGKGEMKTYWLDPTKKRRNTKSHKDIRVTQEIALHNGDYVDSPMAHGADVPFDDKYARLIDWNVDVLLHHLARVISSRSRTPSRGSLVNHSSEVALLPSAVNDVAEVVALPPFDSDASRFRRARPDVSMLQQTRADLHEYVKRIALMYRDVPFHNFEHASHVTLCANKLLNRLINSDEYGTEEELHNATFGISSDPLTHFAIVFAALIHDVDHTGLPNAQLVKDEHELAVKFDNKSVAEQNSVHIGWEMLMDPRFERLRKCVYQTNVERKRFRQLVINSVMATDIADRQVNEERQIKWDKAFRRKPTDSASMLQIQEDMNRKATAVIEHIIQVSDVAHTMQHWHIYRRWNERLFHEMHDAFQSKKVNVDPSTNWYIGELGFFDYYLIPLAMKLKECGVFGASGYEYISYVLKNKKEWERKGRQVVQEMVLLYKDVDEDDGSGSEGDGSSDEDSDDFDSDDLEYDSPGDLSDTEENGMGDDGDDDIDGDDMDADADADIDSMHPILED